MMPGALGVRPAYWAPLAITGIFIVPRVAFYLAGVRFDMTPVSGQVDVWQLLDLNQLQHNLIQSIWYLHSQPPLYNLFSGLLLQLPPRMIGALLVSASILFALGMVLSCY
jgi:hypothetical protein